MSALAEALVAAQRRALAQLEKEYVRSVQEDVATREAAFREALAAIGLPDRTDADALISCLEVLRVTGGALPAETRGNGEPKADDKATDAQLALIAQLVAKHKLESPDLPLTKTDASAIITAMKDGSYDAAKYRVPF